ncbi:MAG TPA: phenylalanine--tRNA ligase subunit beta [Steroidobacteraceae bacterium]|nr:phenylalanine--tRNA ligase subunit beta [Steroidobacteraceae bacterium]
MRISYQWLSEWVSIPWDARELGERLTMAGFELERLEPAAPPFSKVVVAEILEVTAHPQADKLRVCRVRAGHGEPVQIVCGASNARAGLRSALAEVGATLPEGLTIKAARLRGIESQGMLCSAKELGLSDSSSGILELPPDAPIGRPLREYLGLDDLVLELNVTPNRGDALSVLGIAREVAALSGGALTAPRIESIVARNADQVAVRLDAPAACPKFVGRVIRGLNNRAITPEWLRERLRRAGLRSVSPIVDVTNYVMLELGQPMHAYDLAQVRGDIEVRMARAHEPMRLLDGRSVELDPEVLVIADREGAVGVAGIMGGERSAVSAGTVDVFLESAYFSPEAITGRARRLGALTDAAQRFERGVDPAHQERAIERATELLYGIAGGSPGAVILTQSSECLPRRLPVRLRRAQLARLLGTTIDAARVEAWFAGLQMSVTRTTEGWAVTPPSHRFDVLIEADLIEEIARLEGFGSIAEQDGAVAQRFSTLPEEIPPETSVLENLASRGYHEVITYAFVDPTVQSRLFPERPALALANPIASELAVMRVSLWPGLLRVAGENQRRQQERVKLIERGARFALEDGTLHEIDSLGGIALGTRLPEQWGSSGDARSAIDFYDVKDDLEALLQGTGAPEAFSFEPASLSCLHPGRAARIVRKVASAAEGAGGRSEVVGWIGELHPRLVRQLELSGAPVLFELDFRTALRVEVPRSREVSRFPQVRRDIAIVVEEAVTLSALRERVTLSASRTLQEVRVFDVYRGGGVEQGRKSVALGLIFQDISRTLTDEDVDRAVASIVADLGASLGARIRE